MAHDEDEAAAGVKRDVAACDDASCDDTPGADAPGADAPRFTARGRVPGVASPRLRRVAVAMAATAALALAACASRPGGASRELSARPEPSPAVAAALASDRSAGEYAVDVRDFDWIDETRGRTVPARVYLPRGASRVPMVVFSHGLGGSRYGYSHLGRYWAAHGIAALHLQHPGSDRAIWTAQGLAVLTSLLAAATPDNAIARVRDVSFALDRVLADPGLARAIDPARIGVAGHSFGANTALLAAGARFRENGEVLQFADARIRAAIIMSAPSLPADQDPFYTYSSIAVPTLHLTGTQDVTAIPGLGTSPPERRIPFDSIGAAPRYLGVYDGGRHSMFSDWSSDATALAIKASTRAITLAFWRAVFDGDVRAAGVLRAPDEALPDLAGTLSSWEISREDARQVR